VFVVDPDPSIGAMARSLLDGSEVGCETFANAHSFLEALDTSRPGCVVLEQRIPDMSGFQLLRRLAETGIGLPLVFVLGRPNVPTAVELMRSGAVHVLEKPLRSIELLNAIQEALELDQNRRARCTSELRLRELVAKLSRKEREVLELIGLGRSVKSIAAQLDLSVRAVEQRRRGLMEKLSLHSPVELLRFSLTLKQTGGLPLAIAGAALAKQSPDSRALSETNGPTRASNLQEYRENCKNGSMSSSFASPAGKRPGGELTALTDAVATAMRERDAEGIRAPRTKRS